MKRYKLLYRLHEKDTWKPSIVNARNRSEAVDRLFDWIDRLYGESRDAEVDDRVAELTA